MGSLFRILYQIKILGPVLRPLFRILLGLIAIPIFRFILRHLFRVQELDDELEKDLEQWFKGTLVLLAATKNMEMTMFAWVDHLGGPAAIANVDWNNAWVTGLRILMVIGVIEMMPDQELFAIIHPGPPKFKYDRKIGFFQSLKNQFRPIAKGLVCQHLNRSSPVFAILCAIFDEQEGWICFGIASIQYLIIGLVTSRDRVLDALSAFDRQVAIRRQQIKEEFSLDEEKPQKPDKTLAPNDSSLTKTPEITAITAKEKADSPQ